MSSNRRLRVVPLISVLMLVVTGCSLLNPTTTSSWAPPKATQAVNAPTLPKSVFAPIPDRDRGVRAEVTALATDSKITVAVGSYQGNVTSPMFRWSTDAGKTWKDGALSDKAATSSEVGETSAGLLAVSKGTWLAVGRTGNNFIVWTSKDAQTWERSATTGLDSLRAAPWGISATASGFVMVGTMLSPDGSHTIPYAWTSTNGVAWKAVAVTKTPGHLNSVALHGSTLVAVGNTPAPNPGNSSDRVQLMSAYVSTDAGATWRKTDPTRPADSDDFVDQLDYVVSTPNGFLAAGTYTSLKYRTFVLSSKDGVRWTPLAQVPAPWERSWAKGLVLVKGAPMILIGSRAQAGAAATMHTYRLEGNSWVEASLPEQLPEARVRATLGVGSTALVAITWGEQNQESGIWYSSDAGGSWQPQKPKPPASMTARVKPAGLVEISGTELAYGNAQGVGVIWKRNSTGFDPPTTVLDASRPAMGGMAASPKQLIMWGQDQGNQAWAAISSDAGATWTYTPRGTFGKVSQYSHSFIDRITWLGDRWVAVGHKSDNGDVRESALAFTSTDGKAWTQGTPYRSTNLGPDRFGPRVVSDLDGITDNDRTITDVSPAGKGEAVASGWILVDGVRRPALWTTSQQGRTWRVQQLPLGGATTANAAWVDKVGNRIVAYGWAIGPAFPQGVVRTWTSGDAGATWKFADHKDWGDDLSRAGTHGNEFVFAIVTKAGAITVLRSTDGAAWKSETGVPAPKAKGVKITITSASVHGDELHLLVRQSTRLDAASALQVVPLK